MEFGRIERPSRPVDEAFYAIFLAFGNMVGKAVKLLVPKRMLLCLFLIEQAGVENKLQVDFAIVGRYDFRSRVKRCDQLLDRFQLFGRDCTRFVDDHYIRKLNLFNEQVYKAAIVIVAQRLPAIS